MRWCSAITTSKPHPDGRDIPALSLHAVLRGQSGTARRSGRREVRSLEIAGPSVLLLCAPLALVIVGADVMRWVSAMCIDMALVVAFLYCYSPNRAAVKERLSRLIAQDRFMVALAFTLMIGPFGQIAGNRLIAKLGTMAGVLN